MKRINLVTWFAVLAVMFGFSSCMDEDDGVRENISILKVVNSMMSGTVEFEDVSGLVLRPTSATVYKSDSELAMVHYEYNANEVNDAAKSINIKLMGEPFYIAGEDMETYESDTHDAYRNTVLKLVGEECGIWSDEFLILNMAYMLRKNTAEEDIKEELGNHIFALTYNQEEQKDNGVLKLRLRYKIDSMVPAENMSHEYTQPFSDMRYWRINDLLSEYMSQHDGEYPQKVMVEFYQDFNAGVAAESMALHSVELKLDRQYLQ